MPTPSIQTLVTSAQQVLNLDSISAVRSVVAVALANANTGTPLNPNLTTQQLWNEFYQVVTKPKSDIESIIANQLMKFLYAPPAPGGAGANGQVIFNDNGVLAGDAGLTYNKATDALTITGDLTVDTSTLKVDSANNRVGIGTASPSFAFQPNKTSQTPGATTPAGAVVITDVVNTNLALELGTNAAGMPWIQSRNITNQTYYDLLLNPNGGNLGLGVTPSAWSGGVIGFQSAYGVLAGNSQVNVARNAYYGSSGWTYVANATASLYSQISGEHRWSIAGASTGTVAWTQAMTLDASGNLGCGITNPSHRIHALVSSGADRDIFAAQVLSASNGLQVKWNHATTTLRIICANLPTASAGLAAGTLWNDAGTIKIA